MLVGVYGSGYLGTVISACLADFGTPVSCCDTDSTRMVEMAQGNICFFEKNLKEIVKRNVRCGRLVVFHRRGGVLQASAGNFPGGGFGGEPGRAGAADRAALDAFDHVCGGDTGSGRNGCQARTGAQRRPS